MGSAPNGKNGCLLLRETTEALCAVRTRRLSRTRYARASHSKTFRRNHTQIVIAPTSTNTKPIYKYGTRTTPKCSNFLQSNNIFFNLQTSRYAMNEGLFITSHHYENNWPHVDYTSDLMALAPRVICLLSAVC